ncbi:uncharacterized protein [Typha latifolia]|uniref:uncharacterized protein n=1 Tax=Typha latifolia TaxID=4733 RepID=UPI003C2BD262
MAFTLLKPFSSQANFKPQLLPPLNPTNLFLSPTISLPHQTHLAFSSFHKPTPISPISSLSSSQAASSTLLSPPSTREEAISQAKTCISTTLKKPLNNPVPLPTRKLKKQKQPRYRVEIPVIDDSPSSLTQLAAEVFSDLPITRKGAKPSILVLWSSPKLAELAHQAFSNSANFVSNLDLGSISSGTLSSGDLAVFVAPEETQLEEIREITDGLYPKPVIFFNPKWAFEEEKEFSSGLGGFVESFDVVYSFMGLEVKGILSKRKGVVLKCVKDGVMSGEGWLVMVEEDEGKKRNMKVATRFKKRPSIGEVENVLYNLMAANSPVTKSVKFLKELASNVTGKKAKQ